MPPEMLFGRVLVVAGSDSGGGAGIQGDIKTITSLGGYAATAITALTAQNTQGVFAIHDVPGKFVAEQMRAVLNDIGADVIKTGMLNTREVIEFVVQVLEEYPHIPLVLDPVMLAKGGAQLLDPGALDAFKQYLLPRATLLTPNLPEAQLLTGEIPVQAMGDALLRLGAKAVLIKGGHAPGDVITDSLFAPHLTEFKSSRIDTPHTHGTGCALASAIAVSLAQGMMLGEAVTRARNYVHQAILHAPGLGHGHGPLGHGFNRLNA